MTLGSKIKKARKQKRISQLDLAKALKLNRVSITHYENDNQIPPYKTLQILAEFLDKNITYFFDDELEQNKRIAKQELKTNLSEYLPYLPENLQLKDFVLVKKLDILAGAGSFGEWNDDFLSGSGVVAIERRILGKINPVNIRTIEIIGDSMEPDFHEGDVAIVDMVNHRYDFTKIAGVYIVRSDNAVYIKRVDFLPNGGLKLMSLNPKYGDIELSPNDNFEILGKICGKISYQISKGLIFDNQGIS